MCELINVIAPGTIKKFNNKTELHVLMERENITIYLDACWKLGVSREGLFVTPDLHGRRNMSSVLNNIASLSVIAPKFGHVKTPPLSTAAKSLEDIKAARGPSKWDVPELRGPVMATELIDDGDLETQLQDTRKELADAKAKINTLETSNDILKKDITSLREQLRSGGGSTNSSGGTPGSQEVITLRAELEQLKEKIRQEQDRSKKLQDDLKKAESIGTGGGGAAMKLQLTRLENQVKSDESRSKELIDRNRELEKKNQQLYAEIKLLKSNLSPSKSTTTATTTTTTTSTVSPTKPAKSPALASVKRAVQDEDAKRMSRIVTGHASLLGLFHIYEEVDETLLKKLREVVSLLMDKDKEAVEIEDVLDLKPLFTHDSGRRMFAQLLREYNTDSTGKYVPREISDESMGVLLYLMYLTLGELELRNGADYISGKIIAEVSTLLVHKKKDHHTGPDDSEVKLSIKEHVVWQSLFFWEEYFWDTIAHSFQQRFGDATGDKYSPAAKEFLTQELKKFSKNMVGWGGLQAEAVAFFSQNLAMEIGLEEAQIHELVASIDKHSLPSTRKEKKAEGKPLKRFSVKNQPKKDPKEKEQKDNVKKVGNKLSDSSPPTTKS